MELATLVYQPGSGWATPPDGRLDSPNTLVLVFGAADSLATLAEDSPLTALARTLPRSLFASAATHTIAHARQARDEALVVCIARFDHTALRRLHVGLSPALGSEAAGQQLAHALLDTPGLTGVLVLADGMEVNGPELVRGLSATLPDGLPIAGGMARPAPAWRAPGRCAPTDRPRAAPVSSACTARSCAWRARRGGSMSVRPAPAGHRAQGHTVEEIDGRPALQLYRQYLGRYASGLPEAASHFPLTVFRETGGLQGVIRYVLGIDNERQTIDVAGDIPAGSLVQLSRAGRSELLEGAFHAARDLGDALPADVPVLALVVSCVGRRHVLGEQTEEELEPVASLLQPGSALAGFYSFGEISAGVGERCEMHNMTLTLAALWEAPRDQ